MATPNPVLSECQRLLLVEYLSDPQVRGKRAPVLSEGQRSLLVEYLHICFAVNQFDGARDEPLHVSLLCPVAELGREIDYQMVYCEFSTYL